MKMKLIMDPFSSIKVSADKFVSLIIKHSKMMTPTYMTYLKDTSVGSGQLRALKNLFLHQDKAT